MTHPRNRVTIGMRAAISIDATRPVIPFEEDHHLVREHADLPGFLPRDHAGWAGWVTPAQRINFDPSVLVGIFQSKPVEVEDFLACGRHRDLGAVRITLSVHVAGTGEARTLRGHSGLTPHSGKIMQALF